MSKVINKKLHPYYKTGINGWIGEEVDDNDYIICPICGEILGMNYCDYASEQGCDNKCPKCSQELDYSEIYDFEDTCYFEQLLEIKDHQLAEKDEQIKRRIAVYEKQFIEQTNENAQLKQQLAEKDKEIEYEIKAHHETIKDIELLKRQHNQDKISFCIEKLEKVLNFVDGRTYLAQYIKEQIEELKKEIK